MRIRSKAREIALCLLYEIEISKQDYKKLLDNYFIKYPRKRDMKDFCSDLVAGVIDNMSCLNATIERYVQNWGLDRMAVIDKNILRIASFELIFLDDIPPKVSINEAVELAKKFGDIDSPRFVNGILDKIYKVGSKKKVA
ncbi:MAG: transcription antitermination factor NusB [Candidatus Omnitrophota bacterium]